MTPAASTATAATTAAACVPVAGHPTSATTIQVSPTSGPPGTIICITGYLPGGPDAAHANETQRHATACWDGCRGSLTESVQVAWSAGHAGFFATRLTVPATAWLSSDGPRPLASGTYPVGVQCLAPTAGGCATQPAQATASFRLTGAAPSRCAVGMPCATLQVSPDTGTAGTEVRVSGWAPLTNIIGVPFGYTLVLEGSGQPAQIGQVGQALDGTLSGDLQLPASLPAGGQLQPGRYTVALEAPYPYSPAKAGPGFTIVPIRKGSTVMGNEMLLAPTELTISPSATWASLGHLHPLAARPTADIFGPVVTAAGSSLAYCIAGGVRVSADGGGTWSTVSTMGVAAAAAKIGYAFQSYPHSPAPTCDQVTIDASHPGSLYASFGLVTAKCNCVPPLFMEGFVTTDGGRSWAAVPQPASVVPRYGDLGFGGFQAQGKAVAALFGSRGTGAPAVEVTADGGRTWKAGQLACPATGPCVRWGAAPSSINACMAEFPQPVEVSHDGGASWSSAVTADLCAGTSQLAALSSTEVALISGRAAYPLQISRDGGRTWTYVALPALAPGQSGFPGLMMLPDGALLAQAQQPGGGWDLLEPAATAWCAASGLASATPSTPLTAAAGQLWWLGGGLGSSAPMTLRHVPLAALTCS